MSIATMAPSLTAGTTPDRTEWISLAEAARRLEMHPSSVQRAALAGSIRTRSIAGLRTRYSAEDVARIAS